jgi:hypothetical protein
MLQAGDSPRSWGPDGQEHDDDRLREQRRGERQAQRVAAFDAAVAQIAAQVLPAYSAADGWLERTRAGLVGLLGALDQQPMTARALVIDSIAWGPAVLERRGELLEALAGALDEARAEVEPFAALPETTGENLVGASLSWVHKRLARESAPLVELAPSLMSMIVHPYLGDGAARRELERSTANLGAEERSTADLGAEFVARAGGGTAAAQGPVSRARTVPS